MVIDYSQVLLKKKNTTSNIKRYLAKRVAPQSVLLYVFMGPISLILFFIYFEHLELSQDFCFFYHFLISSKSINFSVFVWKMEVVS